jgi:hypothetical protein
MKHKPTAKRKTAQICLWINADLKAQLDEIKNVDGIPLGKQIELAVALWLRTRPDSLASVVEKLKTAGYVRSAAEVALQGARR